MRRLLLVTLASFILSSSAFAEAPLTKKDVEAIVKQSLSEHPEWIVDSLKAYQEKQQAKDAADAIGNIGVFQKALKTDSSAPVAGNPKGNVTIAEFFDYHCGYCKHALPTITKLIDEDKNIRLVFMEFPILSEDSNVAAKASLAVWHVDSSKYFAYHTELMHSNSSFTEAYLLDTATKLGIDADKVKKEMNSPEVAKELASTHEWANKLHIRGTPAFVIGSSLVPGAVQYDELKAKVAAERAGKK